MKKSMFILLISLLSIIPLWSKEIYKYSYEQTYAYSLGELNTKYTQYELEENFYKERIPAEYSDAFLYYTRKFPQIRKSFYCLMIHESNNFTAFVHKNKDGSVDYGPSQLNSNNIKNATFRKYYNPKDESHITSRYCFYMVMTINFYYDLVCKYGEEYAFFAYNGGERCVKLIKNNIKDSRYESLLTAVKTYDSAVRKIIKTTEPELTAFVNDYKTRKAVEMAINIITKQNSDEMKPFLYGQYIIESWYNRFLYVRREDLAYLELEEIGIISYPSIGTLSIETA